MALLKRILRNSGILLLGRVATKLISFFILLYIARHLGPVDFGKFSFAFAFIYFFGFIPDLGIHDILIREVAKDTDNAGKLIGNATIVKIVLSLVALFLTIAVISIMDYPSSTKNALYIASLGLLVTCLSGFGVIYETNLKMQYSVLFSVSSRIFFLFFVLFAIFENLGLLVFVFASVAADFVHNMLMAIFSKKFVITDFHLESNIIKKLLYESIPVAIASVFIMIYFRIDVVMLSFLKSDIDVGFYSAAYRLTEASTFIPSVLITSIFPLMSKYNQTSPELFNKIYIQSFKSLYALSILMGIVVTLLAKEIILYVYGAEYISSTIALQVLIWATSIMFVNSLLGSTYISSGHQNIIAKISAFAALFNVVLNYALIPSYSYVGASIATLATEFVVMVFGIYWVNKNILHKSMFFELFYPLVGSLLAFIFISLLYSYICIEILVIISVFLFISTLYATKWINEQEKSMILKLIKTICSFL